MVEIEVKEIEGDNKYKEVVDRLKKKFQQIKERNPRGYMDQFDQQMDLIAMDIAQEMGGEVEIRKDHHFIFNFAKYGGVSKQPGWQKNIYKV